MSGLTPQEQATLLDIVQQYHNGTAAPQAAIAWVYGLVANSALWPTTASYDCQYWQQLDRKFSTDPRSPLHHDNRCDIHRTTRSTS